MGASVNKYLDLLSRYAIYGDNGYYVDSHIIHRMIVDELNLHMSFKDIKKFVNNCEISITEREIKNFLNKKFEEENPELKRRIEMQKLSVNVINLNKTSIESIMSSVERINDEFRARKYYFEPYSLQYFITYTSILKEKCQTLFSVLNDINKCKAGKALSIEAIQRLLDLDFHINSERNIYFKDAERLADAIIYNVKDLYEKVQVANNPETYLTFKESKHQLMKDDIWPCEIYPRKEIQIKDRYYTNKPEFIALSEEQQKQIQQEELENLSEFMRMDFEEDDYENEKDSVLQKLKK